MFQLYKKRDFSSYINDTFQFFKIHGKHYFKNYFTINGIFLLIAVVLLYFVFKIYFEFVFSSFTTGFQNSDNDFGNYIKNNTATVVTVAVFGFLLLMFVSLLQFAFPVIYLDLLDKKNGNNFTTNDIVQQLKKNVFKFLKFILASIFIILPLMAIVFTINVLLCFLIIGFPLFLITIPAIMSLIHLTFYNYIITDDGFFNSLSQAFSDLKQQFWAIVLSTFIIYLIIQVVSTIFSMVPYLFGVASIYTTPRSYDGTNNPYSIISIMMIAIMVISFLVSYILNNLLLINQGLIYYSQREFNDNISSINTIDLIGTDSE